MKLLSSVVSIHMLLEEISKNLKNKDILLSMQLQCSDKVLNLVMEGFQQWIGNYKYSHM